MEKEMTMRCGEHAEDARHVIEQVVAEIKPVDQYEKKHIEDALSWIRSGAPLFRTAKHDVPNKHLVSALAIVDASAKKLLLVDHKKALLWLTAGGHVELNENPKETARRECFEELGIEADFISDTPIFLTSTVTVGLTPGHIDITLWYLLKGDHTQSYKFDPNEFNAIRWFGFDEIPYERADQHMRRFVGKLRGIL